MAALFCARKTESCHLVGTQRMAMFASRRTENRMDRTYPRTCDLRDEAGTTREDRELHWSRISAHIRSHCFLLTVPKGSCCLLLSSHKGSHCWLLSVHRGLLCSAARFYSLWRRFVRAHFIASGGLLSAQRITLFAGREQACGREFDLVRAVHASEPTDEIPATFSGTTRQSARPAGNGPWWAVNHTLGCRLPGATCFRIDAPGTMAYSQNLPHLLRFHLWLSLCSATTGFVPARPTVENAEERRGTQRTQRSERTPRT